MISLTVLNQFQNQNGPIPLSQLDTNFGQLFAAINDAATYDNFFVDTSGVANTITITIAAPQTFTLVAGVMLQVRLNNTTSNSSPTINVNGSGAKAILNADGTALLVGQFITAGSLILLQYDGTSFRLIGGQNASFVGALQVNGTQNSVPLTLIGSQTNPVLNLTGTAATTFNAIKMTQGVQASWFIYQTAGDTSWRLFSGTDKIVVTAAGNVTITGTLGINGNAPPAQITGWGTPTGAAVVNNFSGGAATLVNCSNAIAKIITDLKALGLYAT